MPSEELMTSNFWDMNSTLSLPIKARKRIVINTKPIFTDLIRLVHSVHIVHTLLLEQFL